MAHPSIRRPARHAANPPHARLGLGAALLVVASCGTGTGDTSSPGSVCHVATPPARCNATCTTDGECGAGLYCFSGHCTGDCVADSHGGNCGTGRTCTANGRCITAVGVGDGGTTPGDGSVHVGPDGSACPGIDVQLARGVATLMLLIDQSGSMTEHFGDTTRWGAIRRTLVDPTHGVVLQLQDEIRFGLAMYTSHNGTSGGECPILRPPLMSALNNYTAIAAAMNAANPDDDTPTAESVAAAARLLMNVPPDVDPGTRAIVLATDGLPDTCADPDADSDANSAAARAGSVAAVQAAFAQGFHTYVISVGSDVAASHLQALADAGAGMSGATYYQALDPTALTTAFQMITHSVRSCTFTVNGTVDAAQAGSGDVEIDGMPLTYNGADGWRLSSPNQIELVGSACERARTTGSTLTAHFPCGVVTPG